MGRESPGADGLGEALHLERPGVVALQPLGQGAADGVRDQNLARCGQVREARGEVHQVAGHGVGAVPRAAGAARDDLAAGHADVHRDRSGGARGERRHRVADG